MMTEMVERLAKAISRVQIQDEEDRAMPLLCVANMGERTAIVRTVLQVLREPTEEMLHIGGRVDADLSSGRASAPYEDTARDVWQAMLSAAIGGKS